MTNRTIPCPECGGVLPMLCRKCDGTGERVDRRTATAEDALRAEVAALKSKLARYEADLTDEQLSILVTSLGASSIAWGHRDAAIRKVRQEGVKP